MYTLEGSHCVQPTPKSLLKGKASITYIIWNSCAWEIFLSFLIYKFIQPIIYIDIYFIFGVIIQFFLSSQVVSVLGNLSVGSCIISTIPSSIFFFFWWGVGFYFVLFCFSISLLLGTTRCSRLILYISCLNQPYR